MSASECSICMDEFKEPRILPCGHSFCTECISLLCQGRRTVQCPLCKRRFTIPKGNIQRLVRNYALEPATTCSTQSTSEVNPPPSKIIRTSPSSGPVASAISDSVSESIPADDNHDVNGVLFCIGGWSNGWHALDYVEMYKPATNEWKRLNVMNTRRWCAGAASSNGRLYVAGGSDAEQCLDSTEFYDVLSEKWQPAASMQKARSGHSLVSINNGGFLIAIGGEDGLRSLNEVECYDVLTNIWTHASPLIVPREGLSCTVVRNRILAIGGHDGSSFLSSCEMIDMSKEQGLDSKWQLSSPLNVKRTQSASSSYNESIFVFGGWNAECDYLDSIEQLALTEDAKWTLLSNGMRIGRKAFGAATLNGRIFIVGGASERGVLSTVNQFCPVERRFFDVAPISIARSRIALARCDLLSVSLKTVNVSKTLV